MALSILVAVFFCHPFETYIYIYILVKLDHLPRDRGENKEYLSCHHLVFLFRGLALGGWGPQENCMKHSKALTFILGTWTLLIVVRKKDP